MNKYLPKINNKKGFTLIELLIVISIIAVLAVIATTVYSNVSAGSRDARRRSDILAIANSLDVNKGQAATYSPLQTSYFSEGLLPTDPSGTKAYCIYSSSVAATAITANPAAWANFTCPGNPAGANGGGQVSTSLPAAATYFFKVCATLDNGSTVVCEGNQQ